MEIDAALAEIYHANGLQPYWVENGRPGRRAEAIRGVLDDAASQGLEPKVFLAKAEIEKASHQSAKDYDDCLSIAKMWKDTFDEIAEAKRYI